MSSTIRARRGSTPIAADKSAERHHRRLRREVGGDDVENILEQMRDPEMLEQVLGMRHRTVGVDQLAAGEPAQRHDQLRVGRHDAVVDIVDEVEELVRVDAVDTISPFIVVPCSRK